MLPSWKEILADVDQCTDRISIEAKLDLIRRKQEEHQQLLEAINILEKRLVNLQTTK